MKNTRSEPTVIAHRVAMIHRLRHSRKKTNPKNKRVNTSFGKIMMMMPAASLGFFMRLKQDEPRAPVKISEMAIQLVGENQRETLECILSGVRRACPGILQSFHVRKASKNPERITLVLNFFPHVHAVVDPWILAHAIEHSVPYFNLQHAQWCPSGDAPGNKVGAFHNIRLNPRGSEFAVEATFQGYQKVLTRAAHRCLLP